MNDKHDSPPPWPVRKIEPAADYRILTAEWHYATSPRTQQEGKFVVFKSPDWVNIVPITVDGDAVLIRQYRMGVGAVTLEVPGGMIDRGETPEQAAVRELREETGYVPGRVVPAGFVHPNPALFNNKAFTFLALDCTREGEPHGDGLEDIRVAVVPAGNLPGLIKDGTITHSLVINAIYFYLREVGHLRA